MTHGRRNWTWRPARCLAFAACLAGPSALAQPSNDDCADAVPIFDGTTQVDTTGAITDGPSHASCEFDGQTYHDIWFQYVATCTGDLTVSTCNTASYDTDLVVYDGCDCAALDLLECNDDGPGCAGFSSEIVAPVVDGNCYLIRVGGFGNGDQGAATVSVSCSVPGDGACCHTDDTCTFGSIAQCAAAGGTFSEGVLCDPNPCVISGPDVMYSDIQGIQNYGAVGGIRAYALGSHTCNVGDVGLEWLSNGTPGLAMNAYRLNKGRFVQIGMSWVKHACCVTNSSCGSTCSPTGIGLRPGCRDVYSAGWNGGQSSLGARSDINAFTGDVPPADGAGGDAIFKRLQIPESELMQGAGGARYFVEGLYISTDDAAAGNGLNNASYKEVSVDAGFNLIEIEPMHQTLPAIYAWQEDDPLVEMVNADVPGEGRFIVASRATHNTDGTWRYTYCVYNLNSHRSGGSFSVPLPTGATVTDPGFHDVDYHSGEPYDNTDWSAAIRTGSIAWSSPETHAQNPDTNALRWGTMYTFWFDADAAPGTGDVTIGLFRPGNPDFVSVNTTAPAAAGPVPAASTWALIAMALLVLTAGSVIMTRRGATSNGRQRL